MTDPRSQPDPQYLGEDQDRQKVLVFEETAHIDKHRVLRGRVEVKTTTESHEQIVRGDLTHTDFLVERVAVGRTLKEGEPLPQVRTEGDITIVPILEEVLVVEKRLVLKEEVRLRRMSIDETVEIPVNLQTQKVDIKHMDQDGKPIPFPEMRL